MENKIEKKWSIVLWSILGFLIYLVFNFIKRLIADLTMTLGFAIKIRPEILQYNDFLAKSIVIIVLIVIALILITNSKKIVLNETVLDFPIRFAKKIGLTALILYILTVIIGVLQDILFRVDYFRNFDRTYKLIYSNHEYLNFGFNIIELFIILILFFKLIKIIKPIKIE